jgi:hypothetical protein
MRPSTLLSFARSLLFLPGFAAGSPSDLEPTFGDTGKRVIAPDPGRTPNQLRVRPDGRIVAMVIGSELLNPGGVSGLSGVWQLNADGSPDATFGGGTGRVGKRETLCALGEGHAISPRFNFSRTARSSWH